ncbi:hypothetical protein MaudMau93_006357 [Microsporum audouinii]
MLLLSLIDKALKDGQLVAAQLFYKLSIFTLKQYSIQMENVDATEKKPECPNCGWADPPSSLYKSRIKLFYEVSNRGLWHIGSDMILKEDPFDKWNTSEVANIQFIKENTKIPIPAVVKEWVQSDNQHYLLMERAPGETLEKLYPTLSLSDKERIADQVAEIVHQLRPLQSPQIGGLGGTPLHNGWIFMNNMEPTGPFSSDDELWGYMKVRLAKLPEKAVVNLRKRMPSCKPYTWTHGHLEPGNIVIKDGNVSAILDWEFCGYFPVWWEYVTSGTGSPLDAEWLELCRDKVRDAYPEAMMFFRDLDNLRFYPHLDKQGKKTLKRLMEDSE